MIVELAEYEREPDAVKASLADLEAALFGERPVAEAVIAETVVDPSADADPAGARSATAAPAIVGHAIFYETFSTWEGRAGIWLEDLYVRPAHRGSGAGAALFRHVGELTVARGLTRYEWIALDWNRLALDFYARFGAERFDEWKLHRLSGEALLAVAHDPSARPADQ